MSKQGTYDGVSEFTRKRLNLINLIDTIETCRKWKDVISVVVKIRRSYEELEFTLKCEEDDKIRDSNIAVLIELFEQAKSRLRDVLWGKFGVNFIDAEDLVKEASRIVRVRRIIGGIALMGVVAAVGLCSHLYFLHAMGSMLEKIFAVYTPVVGVAAWTYLGIKGYVNFVERSRTNCNGIEHFIFRPTKKMQNFGYEFGRLVNEVERIQNYTGLINLEKLANNSDPKGSAPPFAFAHKGEHRQGPAYPRTDSGALRVPGSAIRARK